MYELKSKCSGDQSGNAPERSSPGLSNRQSAGRLWDPSASFVILLILLLIQPVEAQTTTSVSSSDNPCPVGLMPGQDLFTIPVLGSANGKLQGTMILGSEQDWMTFRFPVGNQPNDTNGSQCQPQFIRTLRELGAVPTTASVTSGPFSKGAYPLPRPGPTLRFWPTR